MNTERQYIYKYVDGGIEKYVGITKDLSKRLYQHTKDKLNEMKNPDIYYFPVKHRGDADMLETYLINYYGTGRYYNVSKRNKGDFSFFDICDRLPWVLYKGKADETLPLFSVSNLIGEENIKIVYKPQIVYMNNDSDEAKWNHYIEKRKKLIDYLDCEIKTDTYVIDSLNKLLLNGSYSNEHKQFIKTGIYLHKKRLQGFLAYQKEWNKSGWSIINVGEQKTNNARLNRLTDILYRIRLLLERHEGHKYNDDWKQEYYVNKPSYLLEN